MRRPAHITPNREPVRRPNQAAAHRVNRSPADIQLVAVSKTFPADDIRCAVDAGQRVFGENRVQEALPKVDALRDLSLEWHLIGHLQTNKAKKAAPVFGWIESVDSLDLLRKLEAAAAETSVQPRVLIQVDLARETTKYGVPLDGLDALVDAAAGSRSIDLSGLMLIPPFADDPEHSRPWFRRLREIRAALLARGVPAERLRELSMGMSHDFEIAVEEGATIVRVGNAIFGDRA
jgi:pyridoxal phosphate enzyme (YggS family)